MHQAGLLDYAVHKVQQKDTKNPCSLNSKDKQQQKEPIFLKLNEFVGTFLILGAGLSFSFTTFIAELIINKCRSLTKK